MAAITSSWVQSPSILAPKYFVYTLSEVLLASNPILHSRTKHLELDVTTWYGKKFKLNLSKFFIFLLLNKGLCKYTFHVRWVLRWGRNKSLTSVYHQIYIIKLRAQIYWEQKVTPTPSPILSFQDMTLPQRTNHFYKVLWLHHWAKSLPPNQLADTSFILTIMISGQRALPGEKLPHWQRYIVKLSDIMAVVSRWAMM